MLPIPSISLNMMAKAAQPAFGRQSVPAKKTPAESTPIKKGQNTDVFERTLEDSHSNEAPLYRFGTAGFRAQREVFEKALPQLSDALADFFVRENKKIDEELPVVIGGDTRPVSHQNKMKIALNLLARGLDVYVDELQIPSPLLAYITNNLDKVNPQHKRSIGSIILTGGYMDCNYGGLHLLTGNGEVPSKQLTQEIEKLQKTPENYTLKRTGSLYQLNPRIFNAYTNHIMKLIDFDKIKAGNLSITFDHMQGATTTFFPQLMVNRNITMSSLDYGIELPEDTHANGPNPIGENLNDLAVLVKEGKHPNKMKVGLANDGSGERFGVIDENGNYVNTNDALALVLYHLAKNKKRHGVIIRSQATSHMLDELAKNFNVDTVETPVGFKYIAEAARKHPEDHSQPMVMAGEASGGLTIYGHIPNSDGIIANLSILELMATEKKPLSEILKTVKSSLKNKYAYAELAVKSRKPAAVMAEFETLALNGGQLNGVEIDVVKTQGQAASLKEEFLTQDGVKLYLKDGSWVLARQSGTEPVVRVYYESIAKTPDELRKKQAGLNQSIRDILLKPALGVAQGGIETRATTKI